MPAEKDQALFKAIQDFDIPAMEKALQTGANPDAPMDGVGRTPLIHLANISWYDRIAAIDLLLKHKADPNLPDRNGQTPLHAVAKSGVWKSEVVVQSLLSHGAKLEAEDKFGHRPLHVAVRAWLEHNSPFVLKELLENGADVHAKNKAGFSPMEIAINSRQMPEGKEKMRDMFNRYAEKQAEAEKARHDNVADQQARLRAQNKKHRWNLKK